jgi:2-succinyl-5-enolpyruvyl-6-hydroxy-3-cyclohexene-1-carboxylate synthase
LTTRDQTPTLPADGMPEGPTGNPATDFSIALMTRFVAGGVRDVVLSPGSRSQPLALVAAELERIGAIRLHVRIDERSSAFVALGLARESGMPALVVTTSGTATANLFPAVLEAHHSGIPIIVLTADRPGELRGIRSNQTTVQPGMYGGATRLAMDVAAPTGSDGESTYAAELATAALEAACGIHTAEPGPVQVNLGFREPLSVAVPDLADSVRESTDARGLDEQIADVAVAYPGRRPMTLGSGSRTIVIAGADAGDKAEALARAGGWPLIAEVSSGSRFGPNLVVAYRELLSDPEFGGRVERAVVFGHPTLSREVPALLGRDDVLTVVVAPTGGEVYNPSHRAAEFVSSVEVAPDVDPSGPEAREWVGRWVFASRGILDEQESSASAELVAELGDVTKSSERAERLAYARAELAVVREPVSRRMLVETVWKYTWPHDRLILGASRLIRDADRVVPGKKIRVHSNRGLAGIDGTIATAIGVALAHEDAPNRPGGQTIRVRGITRVLLGDLTLLHDAGSLLFLTGERRPNVQLVVGNDGGGTIFDSLEVAWSAPASAFDRVLYTPQTVDLSSLAVAYGWSFRRASTRGELEDALSAPASGTSIVEVPLER